MPLHEYNVELGSRRGKLGNRISLRKSGTLSFSSEFYTKHINNKYEYIRLAYDNDTNEIVITFERHPVMNRTIKIRHNKAGHWVVIKNFLSFFGIEVSKTYAFTPYAYNSSSGEQAGVYSIKLDEPKLKGGNELIKILTKPDDENDESVKLKLSGQFINVDGDDDESEDNEPNEKDEINII